MVSPPWRTAVDLTSILTAEWQRLGRDQQPLSLILCDLDHFKRYNDTFGHPAGDRCLIRVARALLQGSLSARQTWLLAMAVKSSPLSCRIRTRTGPGASPKKFTTVSERSKSEHAPDNEEPYVTVTMGVSTVSPRTRQRPPQMLVQASDLALYHAKQQGRNRTYINGHYNTVDR